MMTDIAAVTGQGTVNPAPGTAKAGTKGAGGAFAAIFGTAAGKGIPKDTDGAAAKPVISAKPGAQAPDPALAGETVTAEIDPDAVLADAGVTTGTEESTDATDAKPRKPGTRRKGEMDPVDGQPAPIVAAFLPATANAPSIPQGKPQADVTAIDAAQPAKSAAPLPAGLAAAANAVTIETVAKPAAETDGKAASSGKHAAPAPAGTQSLASTAPATIAAAPAAAAHQQGNAQTDGHAGQGNGRAKDQDSAASPAQLAANDDTDATASLDALHDIMQSLPPVLQSQLAAAPAPSLNAAPIATTGDLLSSHAIDMSVSGQWIDRMAQEISKLADGTGHSSFQLSPPNLGKIQVDLWQGDGKMNLHILTETDEATNRLRDGQGALETHAHVASLSLGSVSIEKSSAPFDSGREQGQRQNADANGNAQQQQQQASAQAQGQSGRGNSSGNLNRGGFAAVMNGDGQAEPATEARTPRADDPRVRFA